MPLKGRSRTPSSMRSCFYPPAPPSSTQSSQGQYVCIDLAEREEECEKTLRPLNHFDLEVIHITQELVMGPHLDRQETRNHRFWGHSHEFTVWRGVFTLADSLFAVSATKSFSQRTNTECQNWRVL